MTTDRLAYFVMVHHKPYQFEWLMRAIYTPDDLFLVHVDLKSRLGIKKDRRGLMREVRRICAGRPNIVLMRSRATNWGGWSLSRVLIDAVRQAREHPIAWSHFVNLSGQCYPLKPIADIKAEIVAAGDRLHVELKSIATQPADDWHHRWSPMIETPLRAFRLPGRRRPPSGFTIEHKGSQWVVLPRTFCEWAVNAPLTRRVSAYLRRLLLSDELVVQALATNGPWHDRIAPSYGRAIYWPGPKLLTIDDLPRLLESGAWFARKFDVQADAAVLHALARHGRFAAGPAPVPAPNVPI
jgi:hypothetical protein